MKTKELAAHEIRIRAEKGNKTAQKELARRRENRVGMLVPYWEEDK